MKALEKEIEEFIVMNYFREKYPHFPKGKLVRSESPDFILKLNRKNCIGIELTRLDFILNDDPHDRQLQLTSLLEKKQAKLRLYKKKLCRAYWLIMSTDDIQFKDIQQQMVNSHLQFDKVFLFNLFSGEIVLL
ncbi:MAG: hypothetical protein KQH67_09050 [Bacteroidetes bacterium]|nr:hypothetical protein [Bacteroidota bacterium]